MKEGGVQEYFDEWFQEMFEAQLQIYNIEKYSNLSS